MFDAIMPFVEFIDIFLRWVFIVLGFCLLADTLTRVYYFYANNHMMSEIRSLITWSYFRQAILRSIALIALLIIFLDGNLPPYLIAIYSLCVVVFSFFPEVKDVDEDVYTVTLQKNFIFLPFFFYGYLLFYSSVPFNISGITLPILLSFSISGLLHKPVYRWPAYIQKHWTVFGPLLIFLVALVWFNTQQNANVVFALSLIVMLYPPIVYFFRKIPNADLIDPKK